MRIGVTAFPLSKGKETGRGLDRTFEEIANGFAESNVDFHYYELGFIPKESQAIFKSWKFIQLLKKTSDDIYLAVYPVAAVFPILLKKRPLIVGIHDMIPFHVFGYNNRLKYAFKRWAIKFAARKSDHIIVGLATTKKEVVDFFAIPEEKVSIVPYGINPKTYYLDKKIKKILGRITFLGEAKRAKGMDTAIKAFQLVLKKFPDSKLILASSGSELPEMKKMAEKILPKKSFEFAGFIPEKKMRKFYASSDIFVFPSRYGFGLSALEAMACGTPAIVGDTLDARDFFTDNDLLSDPNDPKKLAEKIIRLLDDRKLYSKKRIAALKAVKNFTWKNSAKGYYSVCKKIYQEKKNDKNNFNKKARITTKQFVTFYNWLEKHPLGKFLRLIVSVGILSYIIFNVDWNNVAHVFKSLNLLLIFTALTLNFAVEFFSIKRHQLILRQMGEKISLRQLSKLYFFGLFASLFMPAGGDISKFVMLKTKMNIRLKTGAKSLIYDRLVGLFGLLILSSLAIVVGKPLLFNFGPKWIFWLATGFLLIFVIALTFLYRRKKTISLTFIKSLLLSLIYLIIIVFMTFVIGLAINPSTKIGWYFLAVPIISFGSMLPISIGGLGVREWLFIFFASYLGLTKEGALSISLILWLFLLAEGIFGATIYNKKTPCP